MAQPVHLQSNLPAGVWRANQLAGSEPAGLPTGHAVLDSALPGGGWPRGALTEILYAGPGCGELEILLSVLRSTPEHRWSALVSPPFLPYAPALAAGDIALNQLLIVRPEHFSGSLWAARQLLNADCCHALLIWATHLDLAMLRRLQLAAENSQSVVFLLRPTEVAIQPSPARLRLQLDSHGNEVWIRILKRRGPLASSPVVVPRKVSQHVVDSAEIYHSAAGTVHSRS